MVNEEHIEALINRFRYFESFGLTFEEAMDEMVLTDHDGSHWNAWVAAVILNKDVK